MSITRVGIIGSGIMGAGIAEVAAANGHIGAAEQRNVQRSENRQSGRIYRKKHNDRVK